MSVEKSEVEQSWESGQFEDDLKKLDKQIKKELWAHDRRQRKLQREDFMWKGILTTMSILFGVAVAGSKIYYPGMTDMLSEISLMALIPALMGLYAWRDPAGKRSIHILVAGQKSDTQGKINLQLIQKPKYREMAQDFYQWIHAEYARVSGTNGAYLSGNLLSQYPEEDSSSEEDSSNSSDEESEEKKDK